MKYVSALILSLDYKNQTRTSNIAGYKLLRLAVVPPSGEGRMGWHNYINSKGLSLLTKPNHSSK
jgi:hypothetical protein